MVLGAWTLHSTGVGHGPIISPPLFPTRENLSTLGHVRMRVSPVNCLSRIHLRHNGGYATSLQVCSVLRYAAVLTVGCISKYVTMDQLNRKSDDSSSSSISYTHSHFSRLSSYHFISSLFSIDYRLPRTQSPCPHSLLRRIGILLQSQSLLACPITPCPIRP